MAYQANALQTVAVLTITNPSAFGVVANCKVLVSYQIAGF